MKSVLKWGAIGFAVLAVIAALTSGGGDKATTKTVTVAASKSSTSTSTAHGSSKPTPPPPAASGCGTRATDDCTPHVPPNGHVRVDALTWRVVSARVTQTLGDQQYGLGEKANGRFVVLKLHVHSYRDESATLSDDVIHLEVGGNTYDADNDGTVAAMGTGDEPFFLDTIGPDSDRTGTVVFDLPTRILKKKLEVRFNELGFGSTKGYILLPKLDSA